MAEGARSDLVDKGRRLFQFLSASQRLRLAPARTTETYERQDGAVFWLGEVPEHPAVSTAAREDAPDPEAPFLAVARLQPQPPPPPDPDLEPWLEGPHSNPERPPAVRQSRTVFYPDGPPEGEMVSLEDRPDVLAALQVWQSCWNGWAEHELADRPVRKLYRELFAAFTTVTSQPEDFELVLGVGCLAWHPEGYDGVRRHALVAQAGIMFDESTGTLSVHPEPSLEALTLELDMLDPALAPVPHLHQDIVSRARTHEAHPLDRQATGDLLRRLVNSLHAEGRYDPTDSQPGIGGLPVLAFAPAVVLRRRSQVGLLEVFRQIETAITEKGEVPAGLLPLVDANYEPPVDPDPSPGAMISVDEEVFLPMPMNDRQLDIVQRVDRQAQTLVQGPPGTGKTHLAAALIAHLLAQGKRVLVTAQTDRALKEVRSKLPAEIKPLAVAVLGSDLSDMADLKVAVENISRRSNEGDSVARDGAMADQSAVCLARIDELRRRRADLRSRLVDARSGEVAERAFLDYTGTLAAIARTYREQESTFGWILEYTSPASEAGSPLSTAEAERWLALLRHPDEPDEEAEASLELADPATLPTPQQFGALLDQRAGAEAHYSGVASLASHLAFDRICALDTAQRAGLQQQMEELARRIQTFEQRRETWIAVALHDIRTGRASTWGGRARTIRGLLDEVSVGVTQLGLATRVTFAAGADRPVIEALASSLRAAVVAGKAVAVNSDGSVKIGTFTSKIIKDCRPLFDSVRVDGRPPTTADQLSTVLIQVAVERHLDALDQAWPATVSVPLEDTVHERLQWHATELKLLEDLLTLGHAIAVQSAHLDQLAVPQPDWNDLNGILAYVRLVDAAAARETLARADNALEQLQTATAWLAGLPGAARVCSQVHEAVSHRDRTEYQRAADRLHQLRAICDRIEDREALLARVIVAAPNLAFAVLASPQDEAWTQRFSAFTSAWDWARVGLWILGQETADANELEQQLDLTEDAIRHQIEWLAGIRAWRHALGRLTGQARADLNHYVQLVKRLGKGTGKFAAARRAEIRIAMDNCRPAVPVWIMPIYRIAEQLHVTENMFDVVIVDEASQAGLEATFLQYLAPKIVVIGDDKQVSPSAVGVDQQQLRDLASQYLYDHRFKASWQDPKLSLFDAASIWYGSKRTLVEHRRCVPEIIGFSNRIAYEPENIRLVPVRQFGADRLNPVIPVHVPSGFETGGTGTKTNRPEAEAVAAQVQACLSDPRYAGKSLGVISLLGARQAKLINDLLLEHVPPEDWAVRDLRCGDAAAFQGSERDVMFLSMVSAPEPGQRIGALTLEANVQRYNVAASRAKDQMWVFHSVRLDQLTNPEDMRFRLLDYCYNAVPNLHLDGDTVTAGLVSENERVEPFDSLFEQRVHNRLIARGYTVVPQFESMGYRIDLVVIGSKTRLAVECDGDFWHGPEQYLTDLARERDLHRSGWEFFRVRESAFYVDEHAVMSRLWAKLDKLGIRPAGWSELSAETVDASHDSEPSADSPLQMPDQESLGQEAIPSHVGDQIGVAQPGDLGGQLGLGSASDQVLDVPAGGAALAGLEEDHFVLERDRVPGNPPAGRRFVEKDDAEGSYQPSLQHDPLPADLAQPAAADVVGVTAPQPRSDAPVARSARLRPYATYRGWAPPALGASRRQIELVLTDIVAAEGPVMGSRIQAAYVAASGGQRVGRAIAHELNTALNALERDGVLVVENPLKRVGVQPRTFRLPDQPLVIQRELGPRALADVPPRELAALLQDSAADTGWETDALYREALRRLGLVRLTTGVQQTLSQVLPLAVGMQIVE